MYDRCRQIESRRCDGKGESASQILTAEKTAKEGKMFARQDYLQIRLYDSQVRQSSRGAPEPGPAVKAAERKLIAAVKSGIKEAPAGVPQEWYDAQFERYARDMAQINFENSPL